MGVIVLGMHRSGTSAIARAIDGLGVPLGAPLLPPQFDNPTGFGEVAPLVTFNDALLGHLGGTWDAPPRLEPGWERARSLGPFAAAARTRFDAAHPGPTWVWKDPRTSLLLPFWLQVLGTDHVCVVAVRDPTSVARSLLVRDALPAEVALAIWERTVRAVLHDCVGIPVVFVSYDDLVAEPSSTLSTVAGFLEAHGQLPPSRRAAPAAVVDATLRHHDADERLRGVLSCEQRALQGLLEARVGAHEALDPVSLPEETPWVEPVLRAWRTLRANVGERATDADGALAHVLARLAETERTSLELAAARDDLRQAVRAFEEPLGHRSVGRLERAALRAAGGLRRIQQRITRA